MMARPPNDCTNTQGSTLLTGEEEPEGLWEEAAPGATEGEGRQKAQRW